jgi:hypothetical protein
MQVGGARRPHRSSHPRRARNQDHPPNHRPDAAQRRELRRHPWTPARKAGPVGHLGPVRVDVPDPRPRKPLRTAGHFAEPHPRWESGSKEISSATCRRRIAKGTVFDQDRPSCRSARSPDYGHRANVGSFRPGWMYFPPSSSSIARCCDDQLNPARTPCSPLALVAEA